MSFGKQPFGMGAFPFGVQLSSSPDTTIHVFASVTPALDIDRAVPASSIKQRVQITLSSRLGSSLTNPSIGVSVPLFVGPRFAEEMTESVTRALARMILDGEIEVISVSVETESSRALTTVKFKDLTTDTIDEVTV